MLSKKKSCGFETDESLFKKLEIEMDKASLLLIQVNSHYNLSIECDYF